MPAAPAPAQLQGQQGLQPLIWALTEASGLKQLLVLIFLVISFWGILQFSEGFVFLVGGFSQWAFPTRREESGHKQILIKPFF